MNDKTPQQTFLLPSTFHCTPLNFQDLNTISNCTQCLPHSGRSLKPVFLHQPILTLCKAETDKQQLFQSVDWKTESEIQHPQYPH